MSPLLIFLILSFLSICRAQDRSHGLHSQPTMSISPQAYAFFHPKALPVTAPNPCSSSNYKTLPQAATVKSTPAHESAADSSGGWGLGPGGIAGISLSFVFVCLVGMGVYYVMIKRRANLKRGNPEQSADV